MPDRLKSCAAALFVVFHAWAEAQPSAPLATAGRLQALAAESASVDVEAFFAWAQRKYPQYFPGPQASLIAAPYVYRHYPATNNYLGVADGAVYVLGPVVGSFTTPYRVGALAGFVCQVHPETCKPARRPDALLVDAPVDLKSRSSMEALLGGPLFARWNPTSAGSPGMKIMMFGATDAACAPGLQGPLATFADSVLAEIGYPGPASAVPSDMRFEAKPAAGCTAGAIGKRGPSRVFADGSRLWFSTASLGGADDLLRPFTSGGQNGQGTNAKIINTSVNYRLPHPNSPVLPWVRNGTARLSTVAAVARLRVTPGPDLNQVKQQMAVTFDNIACRVAHPGRLCSIQWLFALGIAQSNVIDWSTTGWARNPNVFGDPVQNNMPIIDVTLIPESGQTGRHGPTRLPFFTSRGEPTQHAPFEPMHFAVDIGFEQFKNALRVASAQMLGEPVALDAGCAQCERVFGIAWNDAAAWVVDDLLSMQEIYDASGRSSAITGSYAWLYTGPAP